MGARRGRQIVVRDYADDAIGPEHFEMVVAEVRGLEEGEVLVRNWWTSVDPGMRLRLRPDPPAGYFPQFKLGEPLDGVLTVGEVIESRAEGFSPGDVVWHPFGWRELSIVAADVNYMNGVARLQVLDMDGVEPQHYLGALGSMGLTAYAGLSMVGALSGGETVWVSAAAGAVGSLAVQFALRSGNRVVASAGSSAKVAWLESLGATAFNWRSTSVAEGLAQAAPEGIDVYFDNVGGGHLEAALAALRPGGRVALCGSVSEYESAPMGPANLFQATAKELTLRGFRGSLHLDLLPEMQSEVRSMVKDGSLVYEESIYDGLERAPEAMSDMLAGRSMGKVLVRI
ncbi:NADP-dependent oxidoreductase [Gordonia paraffinivorans]|uniref:NADP-dependent oxidoreductase n=1 Tax=Gordonia paraffinivorans TaxID=175628 RepID=UPI00144758EA|nr:NADP-dependent oxidoreductase [Gordonia paraffinivorans]